MPTQVLTTAAQTARITTYRATLVSKLASYIIDTTKAGFVDLVSDQGKPMSSLNGEIILARDLDANGKLKGVISIHPDALSALLPDLKADTNDLMGHKKYITAWKAQGIDILAGVANPLPSEYTTVV